LNDDLRLALAIADEADKLTLGRFQSEMAIRTKADRTPVSEVDEAVEKLITERLRRERPDDSILGEEFGEQGTSPRRWIVDPIDATKNYIRGIPVFATLIALEGQVGVISAPALGRRWWASRGEGAFCNGRRILVSSIEVLGETQLCYDDVPGFEKIQQGEAFLDLARSCGRTRGFGDFWAHMLVAEGAADLAVEPEVALWDMAPIQVIVEEAGGRFTDMSGKPRIDGGSGVSSNGLLHDEVLGFFR